MNINNFCISRNERNKCSKLTVKICIGENCSFAQTKKQLEESIRKCYKRLASLDKELQKYISDKYYGGKMPWLKGGAGYEG